MKIAISQFDMSFEDIETNKKEVKDIIKVAKLNHADLIVFPEMTLTGFTMKCKEMYDESIDDFFKELSQKYFSNPNNHQQNSRNNRPNIFRQLI